MRARPRPPASLGSCAGRCQVGGFTLLFCIRRRQCRRQVRRVSLGGERWHAVALFRLRLLLLGFLLFLWKLPRATGTCRGGRQVSQGRGPAFCRSERLVAAVREQGVLISGELGVLLLHILLPPLDSPVLEPYLDLCLRQVERRGQIQSLGPDHVLLTSELRFQSLQLFCCKYRSHSFHFRLG